MKKQKVNATEERAVLATLFAECGGTEWTHHANWLDDDAALSSWFGVQTDSAGCVTGLELSDNNVTGNMSSFAKAAVQLPQLDQLWLSDNHTLVGSLAASMVLECQVVYSRCGELCSLRHASSSFCQ